MAKPSSRETWLHPSDVTEALKSSLASVAPTIRFSWITSRSAKPRTATGVMICIDTIEAQRIEKKISLAKKSKKKADQLKTLGQEANEKLEKMLNDVLQNAGSQQQLAAALGLEPGPKKEE